jgi:hypothetical protein
MTAPFDIFEAEIGGTVVWLGSAITLEDAKARIEKVAVRTSGEYLVLNQRTGNKLRITLAEPREA